MELNLDLGLFNRVTHRQNALERLLRYDAQRATFAYERYLAPVNDSTQYALLLGLQAQLSVTPWLSFGFAADSGLLRPADSLPAVDESSLLLPVISTRDERAVTSNGQRIADEAKSTAFVRQAFVELSAPSTQWLALRGGRIASTTMRGLVYDDFGLGAQLVADFERLNKVPITVELAALLPTRSWDSGMHSPLLSLRLAYVFSSLLSITESIGLSFAYFHDGDDNFGNVLSPLFSEIAAEISPTGNQSVVAGLTGAATESSANLYWLALDGCKLIGDFKLAGTAVMGFGSLSIDNPFYGLASRLPPALAERLPGEPAVELAVLSFAVDLKASYLLTEDLALGAFFLYLSGEKNAFSEQRVPEPYGGFLGVVPYLTHTNIFFSGGLNETFSGRQATTSGINGRGVIAFGPQVKWEITDALDVESVVAPLFSPVASISGGHFYGVETNLEVRYGLFHWMKLSAEYDLLVTGNFFPTKGAIHKVIFGLDLLYAL